MRVLGKCECVCWVNVRLTHILLKYDYSCVLGETDSVRVCECESARVCKCVCEIV